MLKVFKHSSRWFSTIAIAAFLALTIGAASVYAQPQRISSELASELAVDEDGRVYWLRVGFSEGGEVPQLRRYLGSDNITTLEPNATNFRGLRAQAPFLFYFRAQELQRRIPDNRTLLLHRATSGSSPVVSAVKNGFVYWVEQNRVLRIRLNGDSVIQDVTASSLAPSVRNPRATPGTISAIAVDNSHLYWVEQQGAINVIWRVRTDGTNPQVMHGIGVPVSKILVDDANVYVATSATSATSFGAVYTINKMDLRRRTLITPLAGAETFGLAIDRSSIYWSVRLSCFQSTLIRAPLHSTGASARLLEQRNPLQNLQATSNAVYWSEDSGIYRWPISSVYADIVIDTVEITQGLQASSGDVPLVSGRPTLVRAYGQVRGAPVSATVSGFVHGFRGGVPLPGSPLTLTPALVTRSGVTTSSARLDPNSAPYVLLPPFWTAGTVELRVELSTREGVLTEPLVNNNSLVAMPRFTRKEGLCLVTRPLVDPTAPMVYRVTQPSFPLIVERFLSIYPIADFRVHENPTPLGIPALTDPAHLGTIWRGLVYEDAGPCDDGARRNHIGLVHPGTSTPGAGGLAYAAGAGWAKMEIFPTGFTLGGDFRTAQSGVTLAHEALHTDWWVHVAGTDRSAPPGSTGQCLTLPSEQPIDGNYPYRDGLIDNTTILSGPFAGQTRFVLEQHYGWDRASGSFIRPDDTFDLMGYCRNSWINDFHWRDIFRMFATVPDFFSRNQPGEPAQSPMRSVSFKDSQISLEPRSAQVAFQEPETAIFISGAIDPKKHTIELGAMIPVLGKRSKENPRGFPRSAKVDFQPVRLRLEMLDANGEIKGTEDFTSLPVFDGPRDPRHVFAIVAPIPDGTVSVRLLDDKKDVLWSWASDGELGVDLSNLAVTRINNELRIKWKSTGAKPPKHLIEYSAGGDRWQTIALDHDDQDLTVDVSRFPGAQAARIRVTAYVGLAMKTMISQSFAVETKSPEAFIVLPARGQSITRGAPVLLRGFAYDADDGSLPGAAMSWSIDGYGDVGTGDWSVLPELPAGTHTLRLTVMDREKKQVETKMEIRVVEPASQDSKRPKKKAPK